MLKSRDSLFSHTRSQFEKDVFSTLCILKVAGFGLTKIRLTTLPIRNIQCLTGLPDMND
eukprot:UN05293